MSLKAKFLLLALLPLIMMSAAISWISQLQQHQLSEQEIATFEQKLLASKRQELQHYVSLAMTSIGHVIDEMDQGLERKFARAEVKRILNGLTYGEDGYFFVYDRSGTNLVHPRQPELVGRNLLDLQDSDGTQMIRELLQRAQEGGGFTRYKWNKPSKDGLEDKLSYAVSIPRLDWMMGTGLYVDDIVDEVASIRREVDRNIRNTFFTILVILAATVVLIVLIAVALNVRISQLADQRLRALAHRSVQLQVTQRRHFARELHDGINQLMVSAKLRLNLVDKKWGQPVAREHLHKSIDILNLSIQEVRRVSHDLRPILLDDLGLEAALNNLLDDLVERSDVRVERQLRLPGERLPDGIEITLYRIVQEALTNIEKHAQARHLSLKIWQREDAVHLELQDDGRGFGGSDQPGGIGLLNMRERTELLGGQFSIHSRQGQGTVIRAVFYLLPTTEDL